MIRTALLSAALVVALPLGAQAMTVPPVDFERADLDVFVGWLAADVDLALMDNLSVGLSVDSNLVSARSAVRATYRVGRIHLVDIDYGLTVAGGSAYTATETTAWGLAGFNLTLPINEQWRLRGLLAYQVASVPGAESGIRPTGEVAYSVRPEHEAVLGGGSGETYLGWRGRF